MMLTPYVHAVQITLSLDGTSDDLDERVAATLESFRTHFSVIVQGKSPDEDEGEDVTLLTTTQRQRTAERKASVVSRVSDRL